MPAVFLFCFLVRGGKAIAALFSILFLAVSLAYFLFIGLQAKAWGVIYTLIEMNLANGIQLLVAYTFIKFKEKYVRDQTYTETIKRFAYIDPLTNLPNRLALNEKLEYLTETVASQGVKLAIFFIDLDSFKLVNDTLGATEQETCF